MPATSRSGGNRTASDDNFPFDGVPSRPSPWGKEENEVWTTLLAQIPPELLRRSDAYQLKILCELIVRERKLAEQCRMDALDHKANRSHLQVSQHICRLSTMFGLSPIDRRRIRLQPQKPQDDADEWMAED